MTTRFENIDEWRLVDAPESNARQLREYRDRALPQRETGQSVSFIVSDLIEGTDLAVRIAADRPPHRETARIVAENTLRVRCRRSRCCSPDLDSHRWNLITITITAGRASPSPSRTDQHAAQKVAQVDRQAARV
jgi:hypothetical protein